MGRGRCGSCRVATGVMRSRSFSEEEVASIQSEAEPMAFVDSNGAVNIRVIGAARNIQRQFRRAFERATL